MNRPFVRIWLGQSASQLGDAVVEVTLPVWVGMLTGSPGHVAGVAAAEILPSLLAGPFAGALVLGPALGSAVLLAFGPAAGLVFDALTFVAGAGAVASATVPRPLTGDSSAVSPVRGLVAEVGEGIRVVRRDADLLATLAAGSVVYLANVVWFSVDVFFVEAALGVPKESVGALWAGSGAGGLLGGLAALAVLRRVSWKALLPAGLAVKGAAMLRSPPGRPGTRERAIRGRGPDLGAVRAARIGTGARPRLARPRSLDLRAADLRLLPRHRPPLRVGTRTGIEEL